MRKVLSAENPAELVSSMEDVLVKFGAEWCQPCKALDPLMEELSSEEYSVLNIDIELHSEYAESIGIRSIPTVIRFQNGDPVSEPLIGKRGKKDYLDLMMPLKA